MRGSGGAVTAPHQDARVEAGVHVAVAFGVDQIAELAAGHLPVTPVLVGIAADVAETAVRHLLSLFDVSPRVDVTAGPSATVTVVLHDTEDPGAAPDGTQL